MLKKFFISMLGTIAGLWISGLIFGVLAISFFVGLIASSADKDVDLTQKSVLYLDLKGNMADRNQPGDIWQIINSVENPSESLVDVINAIHHAAIDAKIKGIYINANDLMAGLAAREEIINALREFKESGKWVIAYADNYTQDDYLLATLADDVYLNPMGGVDVRGMMSQVPFVKGLLDKIGIKMQILRVGKFKSAVEPFFETKMSEASRLQTQIMVDSMWNYTASTIAENRQKSIDDVNHWADSMLAFQSPEKVVESGAVTALKYRREVEDIIRKKCNVEAGAELPLITPSQYMLLNSDILLGEDHIAVLFAQGDIVDSGESGIVGETMVPEIIELAEDDNVKAMVLRVNSGGGSAFASEQIWEALEYFKSKGKELYVSMGDYAASGGYYISCGANKIFADHNTLTGSIGVFGMIPDMSGLITDKLGVTFATVKTNRNTDVPVINQPMTAEQLAAMQNMVELTYDTFTKRVANGRGMTQDAVKEIAEGRVWTGGSARELGLVDEIGGLQNAINAIADVANISADKVVYYPNVEDNFMTQLVTTAITDVSVGNVTIDANTMRMIKFVEYLQTMPYIQARMEPIDIQ